MKNWHLIEQFEHIRRTTEEICHPLETDDYQIQSTPETSPPKWHLAHTTWFFETFLLRKYLKKYSCFHPEFHYLFNSYYQSLGTFHSRHRRGTLSRPTVKEIYQYRQHVNNAMSDLFMELEKTYDHEVCSLIELGIHHEQQHQELLLMDIKMNFFMNPLKPSYKSSLKTSIKAEHPESWHEQDEGIYSIGHTTDEFAYDNEKPAHKVFLYAFKISNSLISNGEYLDFIHSEGYRRPELWLSDGWAAVQKNNWQYPLYWSQKDGAWYEFTLSGESPLDLNRPVSHVSYYEAAAFSRWKNKRLAAESEIEVILKQKTKSGNFFDTGAMHPQAATDTEQWYGDLWNWTSSAYQAYPGFQAYAGPAEEYNSKFMCNQNVLRGGSCVSPINHIRSTYRNFYYPHERWMFSGIRLADNILN